MSRRDRRDSDSRRYRSRFDEEPSPKRARRDGKPETERTPADSRENSDRNQKHHQQLQDALPLQVPIAQVSTEEAGSVRKESTRVNVNNEGRKQSLDPTDAPRSRSYFQHDERGNSDQVKRSSNGKAITGKERGWWRDAQEQLSERANRISTNDMQEEDERSRVREDNREAWRHDRYYDIEADRRPPARKRPSFREKKISDESEKDKALEEPLKADANDHSVLENEKKGNRSYNPRHVERAGDREANRAGSWRGNFASRERHNSRAGNYRGRERFTARQGYSPMGGRVEKWKHDLFDEANRSPSPKKEEDMVAKVEALLAS